MACLRPFLWRTWRVPAGCKTAATAAQATQTPPRNKARWFFLPQVQRYLEEMAKPNDDKVFRIAKCGQKIDPPAYIFATDKQLAKMREQAKQKSEQKLQMPPQVEVRKEQLRVVIEKDEAISGYDKANIVFTDITYGLHDRERIIVVREPDGTLREAEWEERDRMNQIYFPKEGKIMKIPAMFEPNNLKEILKPEKYEYILNRNCIQFEPDHPIYQRTAMAVFHDAVETSSYEVLRSTRHYGPMVFNLIWEKTHCDDLLSHYLSRSETDDAMRFIHLFGLLHPESSVAQTTEADFEKLARIYIKHDASKPAKLNAALEATLETKKIQEEIKENVYGKESD